MNTVTGVERGVVKLTRTAEAYIMSTIHGGKNKLSGKTKEIKKKNKV